MTKSVVGVRDRDAGFGFTELLIVLTIAGLVMAMGLPWFQSAAATVQGDADLRILEWQVKLAREIAINQRRSVELRFTPPNQVAVIRHNVPAGTTLLSTAVLEHNTTFTLFAGQPDTPDGFGRVGAVSFGGAASVMFTADGMFTDAAGNPVNGSVFLGQVGRPFTARALTVFGPTARITGYRWNGSVWGH